MVNPFRCKPIHKKAIFAVLTDDALQPLFTDAERAAIAAQQRDVAAKHAAEVDQSVRRGPAASESGDPDTLGAFQDRAGLGNLLGLVPGICRGQIGGDGLQRFRKDRFRSALHERVRLGGERRGAGAETVFEGLSQRRPIFEPEAPRQPDKGRRRDGGAGCQDAHRNQRDIVRVVHQETRRLAQLRAHCRQLRQDAPLDRLVIHGWHALM